MYAWKRTGCIILTLTCTLSKPDANLDSFILTFTRSKLRVHHDLHSPPHSPHPHHLIPCISSLYADTVHVMDSPEPSYVSAAVVAMGTAVVVTTTVIAIIVVVSAAGTAAATAAALLAKYGLQFRTGLSKLEDNLEKMCSEELIQVKDAPDMSFQECVEFAIQTSSHPEDEDGKQQPCVARGRGIV